MKNEVQSLEKQLRESQEETRESKANARTLEVAIRFIERENQENVKDSKRDENALGTERKSVERYQSIAKILTTRLIEIGFPYEGTIKVCDQQISAQRNAIECEEKQIEIMAKAMES